MRVGSVTGTQSRIGIPSSEYLYECSEDVVEMPRKSDKLHLSLKFGA